ncbi:hypothetical protein K502DRAFT_323232 [Neoconidiobolus thromboides FSU 785]|nr:hypothetical protein K502DRAFT_323232 [Neoconidiobolus thromboides FSU 785]
MKSRITEIQSNIESSIPSEHWDLLAIDHKGNKKPGEEIEKSIKQLKKIKNWLDENINLKKETLIKLMAEIQRTADDSPLHTIIRSKRPISTQDLMTKIIPN